MTLTHLIDEYLENLQKKGASSYTIKNYRHYLRELLKFAGKKPLAKELIKSYKLHLARKGINRNTQNYFLIALRSFITFSGDRGTDLLASDITLHRRQVKDKRLLDQSSIDKLVSLPPNDKEGLRDKLILYLLSATNLKISQLTQLNRRDSDELRTDPSLSQLVDRYLALRHDQFVPLFIRYKGKTEVDNDGEKMRLSARSVERMVKKYSQIAQVEATPEILRQSSAI